MFCQKTTHDLINWYVPKLATNATSLTKFQNDNDIVIIADPMIRTLNITKYEPLGRKVFGDNNKIIYESKKVHCFLISTVGLMNILKAAVSVNNKICWQADGVQGLTKDGGVLSSIILIFNRFDPILQRCTRSLFMPI